jgi:hypothetical protein
MITIRNRDVALALSARAGVAGLVPGQAVKLANGAAVGDQPTCVLPTTLDYSSNVEQLFIVDWYDQDSQFTDFNTTFPDARTPFTAVPVTIPLNAQVTLYMGTIVVGYAASRLPASLRAVRESTPMGFDFATHMPAIVADSERRVGFVYRIDGAAAETTLVIRL